MRGELAKALGQASQMQPFWLDGPTGTQLEACGFASHPVLWTAAASVDCPELLAAVHRRYLAAGSHSVTANTFRSTAFAARKAGLDPQRAHAWTQKAVAIARAVIQEFSDPRRWVWGSMAPLGDCYQPQQAPNDSVLTVEHARNADWLMEAGCDGILIETQGSAREALCALRAARRRCEGPILVSFLPSNQGSALLNGDDLAQTAAACRDEGADGLLVNCAHADVVLRAIECLSVFNASQSDAPLLGAYPNADRRVLCSDGEWAWEADSQDRAQHVLCMRALQQAGARVLGACCGFGPDDLAQWIEALAPHPLAAVGSAHDRS